MSTYMELYENEKRAVEITIRDNSDADYEPTTAYFSVVDSEGFEIVSESICMVSDNKIYALIDSTVTSVPDNYEIIWKIIKSVGSTSYIFYHKTQILVKEI